MVGRMGLFSRACALGCVCGGLDIFDGTIGVDCVLESRGSVLTFLPSPFCECTRLGKLAAGLLASCLTWYQLLAFCTCRVSSLSRTSVDDAAAGRDGMIGSRGIDDEHMRVGKRVHGPSSGGVMGRRG